MIDTIQAMITPSLGDDELNRRAFALNVIVVSGLILSLVVNGLLISSEIQNGINTTVVATEEGTQALDNGPQLVEQTGDVVRQVTAQGLATTQQTEQAAHDLSRLAGPLIEVVDQYQQVRQPYV